ncbi:response regulator [Thalassotalea piscium]|uniref:histidine kinase n=1 Tax=Thalassotalea piscium TaxID=1230533 RepID=A0A7X0NKX4_9GAMM|nr:response regulator [Thalassotalea piscium]MBB6545166.1 signal transduction histidine kinase/DNA-binding response OmpR family regulator/ligand-binding sensor domain-containing protein [Thalassotalea piscium]
MKLVVHQLVLFLYILCLFCSNNGNANNLVIAPVNDPALKDLLIRTMFVDKQKRIYIGTDSGLYRYTNKNLVKLDDRFAINAHAFNGAISSIHELGNRYLAINAFLSDVIYFDRIKDGYVKAPYNLNQINTFLHTEKISSSQWLWNTTSELFLYSSKVNKNSLLLATPQDERIINFKLNNANSSVYVLTQKGLYYSKSIELPLNLIFKTHSDSFYGLFLTNNLLHLISTKSHLTFKETELISSIDVAFCSKEQFKRIKAQTRAHMFNNPIFYTVSSNHIMALSECGAYKYDLLNHKLESLLLPQKNNLAQWIKGVGYTKALPTILETNIGLFLINEKAEISALKDKTSASLGGSTFSVVKVTDDQYLIADGTPGLKIASTRLNKFNNLHKSDLVRLTGGHSLRDIIKINNNTIWLGSQTNGLIKIVKHQDTWQTDKQFLTKVHIRSLYKDKNILWVATEGSGLYQINLTDDTINKIYSPENIQGLLSFLPIDNEQLLIGTTNGVLIYHRKDMKLVKKIPVIEGAVWGMAQNNKGEIWLGSQLATEGLFKLDRDFTISETYTYSADLYNSAIMDITIDDYQQPAIATWGGGLLYRMKGRNEFSQLNANDGLLNDTIQSVTKISENQYWLSTEKGLANVTLCQLTECNNEVKTYTTNDGLATNLFDLNSAHLNPDGTLIYGGFYGLTWFKPKTDIIHNTVLPSEHHVNSLIVDGKKVTNKITTNNNIPKLNLTSDTQQINITFHSDDYVNQNNKKYRYRINNSNWATTLKPEISLSALTYGKYLLEAGSSNSDGLWAENNLKLMIIISPPIWLSLYAKIIYIVLFILSIIALFKRRSTKLIRQNTLLESKVQEKTKLLSKAIAEKEHMFESSSHELQTPLTLILNYLDLLPKKELSIKYANYISIVESQSQRLRYLVKNMLLNADPASSNNQCELTNIRSSITTLIEHHKVQANKSNITLNFHSDVREDVFANLVVDSEHIIFGNLIDNAIKYSPNGSIVTITLYLKDNNLVFCISDQGPGFKDLNKICYKYYRESKHIEGTGLGLWNVKEYINKNQGTLSITNNFELGCKIILSLPLSCQQPQTETTEQTPQKQKSYQLNSTTPSNTSKKVYNVLLVEDDTNLTILFKETLAKQYCVTFCCNGNQALEYLQQTKGDLPDIIVSDVMMPIMNGFDLCKHVKQSNDFKHIPFLLLTAKSDNSSLYKGLSLGADDYLNKPFKMSNLQLKINNIITTKEAQKQLQLNYVTTKENIEIIDNNQDKFIIQIKESLKANQQNSSYSIAELADAHNMSTSTLRRKLKQYFDQTFTEILKKSRMNKAKKLLMTDKQIQIIAEECGYTNTSYFNKHFKEEFNLSPKAFRK